MRPQPGLNSALRRSADSRRQPALGQRWLVSIANRNGRERIELVDLRTRQPVPLPGLNQAGSQPVSVSVSAVIIILVRTQSAISFYLSS